MSVWHALLALLSEGPRCGPQLREELAAGTGGERPLNGGRLYATLSRLERAGLVASDGTGPAGPGKEFRITAVGAGELAAWLRTPPGPASAHGQTAAKILAAQRVPGIDVREVVQVHRRSLMELMQQWNRIKQQKAGNDLDLGLRIDAELFRLDSVLRWLDAADGRLMNAAVSPSPPALPRPREKAGVPPGGAPHQDRSGPAGDHIRVSDRDRERATARLRDSFAVGRLTREELDERITAAFTARTHADLWRVTADLP